MKAFKLLKTGVFCAAMSLATLFVLPTSAQAESVTLRFWHSIDPTMPDGVAMLAQIEAFKKAHPDIKIDMQQIAFAGLHDKLVTSIAAGDAPDLSWGLIEWLGELDRMNGLADLTPYFEKWADRDQFYPSAIQALTVNGKIKGLPNYMGIRGLLYHEEMLKKAGISTPPKTWSELIEASQKIKKATGKFGFGIAGTGVRAPQELIMYLAQNEVDLAVRTKDGKHRNTWVEDPQQMARATEVFAFYQQLLEQKAISPQAVGWGYEEEDTNFALGQYAMVVDGAWMSSRIKDNPEAMKDVKIAPPPYARKAATFAEVNPFYVFKSKHPQQTWEFVSFMAGKEYQAASNPDRAPRKDVVSDNMWGRDLMALAPTGIGFPPVALGSITRAMSDSIGRVLLKREKPADTAKWLSNAINKALKKSGELGEN